MPIGREADDFASAFTNVLSLYSKFPTKEEKALQAAQTEETRARTGLLGTQTRATEQGMGFEAERQPYEIGKLKAETGAQEATTAAEKARAGYLTEQATTEREGRPLTFEKIKADTANLAAQTEYHNAMTENVGEDIAKKRADRARENVLVNMPALQTQIEEHPEWPVEYLYKQADAMGNIPHSFVDTIREAVGATEAPGPQSMREEPATTGAIPTQDRPAIQQASYTPDRQEAVPTTRTGVGGIYTGFQQRGLDPMHAAVLAGNVQQESGGNTRARNPKEGAEGIIQWRLDRLTNLRNFAGQRDMYDPGVQMDFLIHEGETRETGAWNRFLAADTPEAANRALKGFIRYGDNSEGTRLKNAQNILARGGTYTGPTGGGQPTGKQSSPETLVTYGKTAAYEGWRSIAQNAYQNAAMPTQQGNQSAKAMLTGQGALDPELDKIIDTIYKQNIPAGEKQTQAEVNLGKLALAYDYYNRNGQPEKAQQVAGKMVQSYRTKFSQYLAMMKELASQGRLDEAAQLADKAYAFVPNGQDVDFAKNDDGSYTMTVVDMVNRDAPIAEHTLSAEQLQTQLMGLGPIDFDRQIARAGETAEVPGTVPVGGDISPEVADYIKRRPKSELGPDRAMYDYLLSTGDPKAAEAVAKKALLRRQAAGQPVSDMLMQMAGMPVASEAYKQFSRAQAGGVPMIAYGGQGELAGMVPQEMAVPPPPDYARMTGAGERERAEAEYGDIVEQVNARNTAIKPLNPWGTGERAEALEQIRRLGPAPAAGSQYRDVGGGGEYNAQVQSIAQALGDNTGQDVSSILAITHENPDMTVDMIVPELAAIVSADTYGEGMKPYEIRPGDRKDMVKLRSPRSSVEMNVPTTYALKIVRAANAAAKVKQAALSADVYGRPGEPGLLSRMKTGFQKGMKLPGERQKERAGVKRQLEEMYAPPDVPEAIPMLRR